MYCVHKACTHVGSLISVYSCAQQAAKIDQQKNNLYFTHRTSHSLFCSPNPVTHSVSNGKNYAIRPCKAVFYF